QEALDQAREALDATADEVLENLLVRRQQFGEREKEFLRKMLAQYQRLVATAGNDTPDARFARANGLHRCAALRSRLGDVGESIKAGKEAVGLYRQLVADVPDKPLYARRLAMTLTHLGVAYQLSGNSPEAIATCQEARESLAKLVAGPNPQPELLADLAHAHCNLGNIYTLTARYVDAETAYGAAIAINRGLA